MKHFEFRLVENKQDRGPWLRSGSWHAEAIDKEFLFEVQRLSGKLAVMNWPLYEVVGCAVRNPYNGRFMWLEARYAQD